MGRKTVLFFPQHISINNLTHREKFTCVYCKYLYMHTLSGTVKLPFLCYQIKLYQLFLSPHHCFEAVLGRRKHPIQASYLGDIARWGPDTCSKSSIAIAHRNSEYSKSQSLCWRRALPSFCKKRNTCEAQ